MKQLIVTAALILAPTAADAEFMDDSYYSAFVLDEFEFQSVGGDEAFAWDGVMRYGNDDHTIELDHSGMRDITAKEFHDVDARLFYRRPVADFFDVSAGIGSHLGTEHDNLFGVLKLSGLLPQFVETELQLVLGGQGNVMLEFDFAYQMMFSQRLIGELSVEGAAAADDDYGAGVAQGLVFVGAGYRLRYELSREFAPYVGWQSDWLLGETADWARSAAENDAEHAFVLGVRLSL